MLAAKVISGVYYVDDNLVQYTEKREGAGTKSAAGRKKSVHT